MRSKRKTKRALETFTYRATPKLVEDFRRVVEARERTVSQALRLHMQETVDQAAINDGINRVFEDAA